MHAFAPKPSPRRKPPPHAAPSAPLAPDREIFVQRTASSASAAVAWRAPGAGSAGDAPPAGPPLRVSSPTDPLEREAERVAERVTGTPSAAGGETAAAAVAHECARAAPAAAGSVRADAPPAVHDVLRSPGRPLDPASRAYFEMRMGRDLGAVRLHTGARAAESARGVGALAYTVGRDVVMGAGRHAPGSAAGDRLLAHELAHVLQQSPESAPPLARGATGRASTAGGPLAVGRAPRSVARQVVPPPTPPAQQTVPPPQQPAPQQPQTPPQGQPAAAFQDATVPSEQIVLFIMRQEGFYATPDDVSDRENCTVGYGHLLHAGPCNNAPSERRFLRRITETRARELLVRRVVGVARAVVSRLFVPVTQNQLDALVSFAYTTGADNERLIEILGNLNMGHPERVPGLIRTYTGARRADGTIYHPGGLRRRRPEEADIWERGDYHYAPAGRHHGCRRNCDPCGERLTPAPQPERCRGGADDAAAGGGQS